MFRLRGALLTMGVTAALLVGPTTVHASGPTTYGITPNRGTASTGITATFSFKTDSAAACTGQQIRFFWDGAFWGSASASWIAGNGTCTGNATLTPPSGALPGTHQTSAADSSGKDTSTSPAAFLLLNPDGSTATPSPTGAVGSGSGGGTSPIVPIVVLVIFVGAAFAAGLNFGRGRRRPTGTRRRS